MAKEKTKKKTGPTIGELLLHVGKLEARIVLLETRFDNLVTAISKAKKVKGI